MPVFGEVGKGEGGWTDGRYETEEMVETFGEMMTTIKVLFDCFVGGIVVAQPERKSVSWHFEESSLLFFLPGSSSSKGFRIRNDAARMMFPETTTSHEIPLCGFSLAVLDLLLW